MRLSSRTKPERQAGFAYLWILLMVAFMGLRLTLAVEVTATATQRERERQLLSIGRQFRTALGRYYDVQMTGGRHEYPATLEDLLQDHRVPGVRRHLRKVFVDPMTGESKWGLVIVGGRIVGIHSLSEKQPIKQDGFEADEISFVGRHRFNEWVFAYPADLLLRSGASK
jgi:hypothetical protein